MFSSFTRMKISLNWSSHSRIGFVQLQLKCSGAWVCAVLSTGDQLRYLHASDTVSSNLNCNATILKLVQCMNIVHWTMQKLNKKKHFDGNVFVLDLRLLEYWNSLVSRGPFSPLQYRPVTIQCHTMQYNSMQHHTMSHNTIQYQVGSGPFSPAPQASFCWEFLRAKAACDPMPLNDHLPLGSFPRRAIWKHIFDPQKPLFPSWHFKKRRLIFSFYIQNSKQG